MYRVVSFYDRNKIIVECGIYDEADQCILAIDRSLWASDADLLKDVEELCGLLNAQTLTPERLPQ